MTQRPIGLTLMMTVLGLFGISTAGMLFLLQRTPELGREAAGAAREPSRNQLAGVRARLAHLSRGAAQHQKEFGSPPPGQWLNKYQIYQPRLRGEGDHAETSAPTEVLQEPGQELPIAYWTDGTSWVLYAPGPDRAYTIPGEQLAFLAAVETVFTAALKHATYDPTNGGASAGDLWVDSTGRAAPVLER